VEETLKAFLARGIAFHTPLPHTPSLQQLTVSDPPNLGIRPFGYHPDTADYVMYERIRDEFLCGPRGRAALMRGGILWRLARDTLPDEVVMAGPSPFNSKSQILESSDGLVSYDDHLSEVEEYLVCGGYHVKVLAHGDEKADMSWWPKSSVWASCGFNVGFWSVSCEDWFQHRLGEIRKGTAMLRTSKGWKNGLQMQAVTQPRL